MRVLFVATCAPRPRNPTKGIFVHQMAKGLLSIGHEVDILVPVRIFPPKELLACFRNPKSWFRLPCILRKWLNDWSHTTSESMNEGVRYIYKRFTTLPHVSHAGKDCEYFATSKIAWLRSRFMDENYTFVLGHFAETIPLVTHLARQFDCPSGCYIHEDIIDYFNVVDESYVKYGLSACDHIFTNSIRSKTQLGLAIDSTERINVVHLGIDNIFNNNASRCKNLLKDNVNIVCVSRFTQRKNQQLLLDALKEWNCSREVLLHLDLVGDESNYREELVQYVKKIKIEAWVTFSDAINLEVIKNKLQQADLFVFPSKFESFGVVLIEAVSQGIPIVSSNEIGAYAELSQAGWEICCFDPHSVESLMNALDTAINNYANLLVSTQDLRQFVLREFSWEKTAAEIVNSVTK